MAGIPVEELLAVNNAQRNWMDHMIRDAYAGRRGHVQSYVEHSRAMLQEHLRRKHPQGFAGLGNLAFGYPQQFQQIEQQGLVPGLPAQSIAEGFRYAFPATSSAFLERKAQIYGGHGGVYSGELRAGLPAGIHPLIAQLYPQLQFQLQPWNNPWTAQQFFGGTPQGLPIWGGGYTQPFMPVIGSGGAQAAVASSPMGGKASFPAPGAAIERF